MTCGNDTVHMLPAEVVNPCATLYPVAPPVAFAPTMVTAQFLPLDTLENSTYALTRTAGNVWLYADAI